MRLLAVLGYLAIVLLVVAGLAFLGMLVFSGAFRSWLRVFVGKHFFSYRYDYREQWLRFTQMLTAPAATQARAATRPAPSLPMPSPSLPL